MVFVSGVRIKPLNLNYSRRWKQTTRPLNYLNLLRREDDDDKLRYVNRLRKYHGQQRGSSSFTCINKTSHLNIHDFRLATFSTAAEALLQPKTQTSNLIVTVDENGLKVKISTKAFENTGYNTDISTFHAPWLWSNCPNHIHYTGARQRTPGCYNGTKIKEASILSASDVDLKLSNNEVALSSIIPVPSPPPDSCHPTSHPFLINSENIKSKMDEEQLLLCISWDDSSPDSYFDVDWLQRWGYDEQALKTRRRRTEVTPSNALRCRDNLVRVPYSDLLGDRKEDAVFDLLHSIFTVGAALVTDAPYSENDDATPVRIIANEVAGSPSHGRLYGDIFHVKSATKTNNIAFTSEPIPPHQDLAYYESVPGLQLLHCLKFGDKTIGGESILIDAMAAAEELRRVAPHHFRTLVSCPATFVKQREGVCMTYLRPHIVLQPNGMASTLSDPTNEDEYFKREIVTVNWAPPFEGPLCVPPDMVMPYYAAYSAFERILDSSVSSSDNGYIDERYEETALKDQLSEYAKTYTWKYRLKIGEILVFNNRRILHGRLGFSSAPMDLSKAKESDPDTTMRHFVGTYTNIDDTLSRYRALLRGREGGNLKAFSNVGHGSSVIP